MVNGRPWITMLLRRCPLRASLWRPTAGFTQDAMPLTARPGADHSAAPAAHIGDHAAAMMVYCVRSVVGRSVDLRNPNGRLDRGVRCPVCERSVRRVTAASLPNLQHDSCIDPGCCRHLRPPARRPAQRANQLRIAGADVTLAPFMIAIWEPRASLSGAGCSQTAIIQGVDHDGPALYHGQHGIVRRRCDRRVVADEFGSALA